MKRIFSLVVAIVAVQVMSAAVHNYKVTSPNETGDGSLSDIVSQINELPKTDEAIVSFDLPSSAKNTINASSTQFVIRRIVSLRGGTDKVTIKAKGFVFPDTTITEISNIKLSAEEESQGLLIYGHVKKLSGCSFSGYAQSVFLCQETASIDLIENCTFTGAGTAGIYSYGNGGTIKGCTFYNCATGIGVYNGTKFSPTLDMISDCEFVNCQKPMQLHCASISKIVNCVADAGNSDIYSPVGTFTNGEFGGLVSFYNSQPLSAIENCHFKFGLNLTASNVEKISKIVADSAVSLTSSSISVLRDSKLQTGIKGNYATGTIMKLVKDTISNKNGDGIYLTGCTAQIDSCIITDCKKNGIYSVGIDELKNSEIKNCSEAGVHAYYNASNLISNCKIHDCGIGIHSNVKLNTIESCEIYNNKAEGIFCEQNNTGKISNCVISDNAGTGIRIYYNISEISNCEITGNKTGINQEGNGSIGCIKKCHILDNSDGGVIAATMSNVDTISECVISGSKIGIEYGRVGGNTESGSIIENNVIGKDGKDASLKGNGIGVKIGHMSAATLTNNIISGNTECGIQLHGRTSPLITNNYIGTNSSLENLGNGIGINSDSVGNGSMATCTNNVIAYNNVGLSEMSDQSSLNNNTFIGNKKAGLALGFKTHNNKANYFSNIFLRTPDGAKAIDGSSLQESNVMATPVISDVTTPDADGYVYVSGTVKLSTSKAYVSIFSSDGREQNATELLGADSSDASGAFKIKVKPKAAPVMSFIAGAERLNYNAVSELSKVYNVSSSKSYYVKTKREGTGDGSSWENAMNGEDFATVLPIASDGATFYVAEGSYLPSQKADGDFGFEINSSVSIIGGYPASAKTGATSDPQKYQTIFTGDPSGDDYYDETANSSQLYDPKNDDMKVHPLFAASASSEVYFYGCNFSSATYKGLGETTTTHKGASAIHCEKLTLEKCVFDKIGSIEQTTSYSNASQSTLYASECIFRNRPSSGAPSSILSFDTIHVKKSLFENTMGASGGVFGRVKKLAEVTNSTFLNVESSTTLFEVAKHVKFYNNTLVGMTASGSGNILFNSERTEKLEIVGNIFKGGRYINLVDDASDPVDIIKNNLLENITGTEADIMVSDVKVIPLEGSYDGADKFTPVIKNNGGFAPTIALTDDKLADGTSIRFPLTGTIVTDDQRGVKRLAKTCMGAYEIGCDIDTTKASDTILVGKSFLGKTYTTVGVNDSIFETLKSVSGCDSVVMHKLVVKPDQKVLNYYVKTERHGTGDGSSWENAMNGEDFAMYLPLAPKGATFYVAEGTYNPVYGMDLTESKSPMYTINNDVTIRGGYPANAETGAASEPDKYKTIFDGDLDGDDEYDEQLDADGYPVINRLNTTENTSTLFFSVAQGRLKARFDGVVLRNVNTAIQLINPDKKLEVLNCSFDHNVTPISLTDTKDSIYVYNSSFSKNTGNVLYTPATQDIVLDSVLFESNASNISSSKSNLIYASYNEKNEGKEHLSMNRVKAIGNKANFNAYGYDTKVENSLFEANMATDLFRVLNNNKTFEIKKSKFIQNIGKNGSIINSDEKIIIDSCLFEKNDASNWDLIGQSSTNNGLYIQHSEFLGNKATDLIKSDAKGDIVISNCNMAENQVGEYLFNIRSSESTPLYKENSICNNTAADILRTAGGTHLLENNTIASNKVTRYILEASGGNLQLNNNTIVGNNAELRLTYLLGLGLKMTGNIILGNSPEAIYLNRCNIKDSEFKYNIAPSIEFIDDLGHCESISDISSNNIFSVFSEEVTCDEFAEIANRNEEILTTLFSGTYNSTTGLFSPEVKNNGGPTPTVALKVDILPDGTSIRFPLTETTVNTDQRGVNRLEQTCMGAYEIACSIDTIKISDTILVGASFLGKTYTTVGVKDSIFENLKSISGCDSIVMHKLVVKPDQKVLNYYVKTEREGTGDGSSWENAMNGTDFANYLPLVPNGVTFYVAEGRYSPINNREENPSHILGDIKEYAINSSLSIIGGYPATAKTGATSDPQAYHTIFTGDPSGDDVYKEGYYNSAILQDINGDDMQVLYLFNATPSSEVYFFGCTFSGASYKPTYSDPETNERTGAAPIRCDKLKIEKCDFSTTGTIQNSGSSQSTLYASECIFHNRPSISTPSSLFLYDTIHVEKSLFEDMIGTTGGVFGRISKLADIKNSTFNNIGSSATLIEKAEHIRLYNNTFVGLTADGSSNVLFSSSRANKMEIVGNIFKGCKYVNLVDDASDPVHVIKNNLLENIIGTEADIMVSDVKDIPLEGTYDGTDAFTPAVKNNGGFTPTIALMKDKLSDGTSIRFPLTETIVTDDQRGVKRLAKTCIGAYEIACSADTTVLSDPDIITVGERFLGVVYSEAGRYDSIFENLQNVMGCDSVVMHTVVVENPFEGCEIGTVLFREDFGGNYISDPIAKSAGIPQCTYNYNENPKGAGNYAIRKVGWNHNQWFYPLYDHTFPDNGDRGYLMQVDGSGDNGVFYNTQIDDLCPNTHLTLSMWGMSSTSTGFGDDAKLKMILESLDGEVLATQDVLLVNNKGEWERFSVPYTVKEGQTSVVYKIINNSNTTSGNDFVLDDIEVRLCKPAVSVNSPIDSLCAGDDYVLTASYTNAGGYIEPLNFTWFKNEKPSYGLDGWAKVAEGQTLSFSDLKPEDNAYYRCVISSAGVPGEFNKCNSASDIVPILVKSCVVCVPDTTVLADPDVIFVGEQFLGVTYTEVGRHDSIFENLKDINGCDSVIMHTLNVQLNPDAKYYYVKTERHGTGDGSNWENAMNGEDLTTYLPLAPDGSTFYVAEGSYKPECEEDYCTFKINSNVTIRGGYPADAKTGDLSDPKKYKTVFDGDKNGDNVITKTTDETGCPVIEVENTDDDAYDMFYSSAERNLNVTFYGISIINAGHGYNAYTESDESALNLNIDNCKFENCRYGAVQSVYLGSLKATESEFIQNGGCLLVPNVTNVELRDVKMENNYNNYLLQLYDNSSNVNKSVTMESVTATNNTAYMQTSGDVVVSNSTFNKNSCIPYFINEQISSEKSSKIHIRNTKFTDNNCNFNLIYASYSEMTVDTSLFQNNTVTTSMIYPHSLTMDSSRVIGNKCGTGVLFEIIKDVKLTNDIINENEAETAIHIYAPTDDVVLVDQCHVESNKGRLFKHENTANGLNVTMTNSEFIGNTADEDNTWINIIGNGADVTVLLNKNIIKENKVSAALITSVSTDFTMSECDVNNNTAKNIMTFASATVHITDNALYSNQVTSNVVEANVCWDGVEIVNNTIAANKSEKDLLSCYYTSTTYNNNTIVGNDVKEILFRYPYDKSFIGNIIWGNNYSELNYYDFSTTPQYNIMPLYVNRDYTQSDKIGVHIPNETNIVVDYFVDKYKTSEYEFIEEGLDAIKQYASINDIFFGTYDPSTSLFTPEIQNNGGFTPTIALKNDRLSDKTSIRFLLSETTVEQDQRGVERLVSTCMGAYEYMPSGPIECVYESILFKEDFGGNNPTDALYSENGLKEGLCTLPCAGDCPLALNDYMQTGCYALLKEAYRRQPGYKASHIYEGWYADFDDETYLGDVQRGYFMSIDMASKPTTFYQREINDLCENTNLSLSMSARPLYASDNTILYMSVEDMTGNPLTERTEVVIDKTVNEWQEYSVTFSVPQGASSVVFKIYSEGGHQGNDFALDDIIVRLCKAQVDVNRPTEPLCKHTDYTLTAQYSGDPSYLEPVNYTWFRNDKETYDLDGWVKVGTGKTYEFKDMTSAINGYYRCVVSSAGVEGEMSKCNSISDIVPIFVSEYTMEKDTVHILQGETFAGVTYEKVGVFRTSNREVNEFGCDKIVNHVVFVHPGGAEYYVTMDGRSAHTGVDWDNAIDSVEFATYLPLAKAGVVFHVAEGRYRPYFNSKYEKVSKRCYYEINNDVTIIGGYSKDELDETVPSNPKKYRTTFTTSINQENNKMVESTSPRLYSMHIDNEAFIGTSRGLFIANAKAKEVKLDGIVLNYSHGFVGDHSETNLTLNCCSFEEMSDPVHYVKSLHVDTCLFRKVSIGGAPSTLFGGVATEIIIRNTTITDILGGYNDMLTCDYHGINPSTFVLENSTLVNNYANGNLIILPSSGKVRIVNNTIVNNQIGTSLSSLFNTHENSVSVEITGNLIVGNENVSELSHVCTNTNGSIYKYNLLDLQQELPETNMKMLGRYTSILDGWNAGNKFIPTLRDNGGYTQTVALKSDRLDDGISIIRLPLEKTTVTADQRQYKRISSTCMGAYEIPLTDCDDLLDLPKEHKLTYETQYISFTVPYRCDVRVIVTDLQGRLVRDADMTYRDREGKMTVNLADLRLFELDHDPREPFLMTVKTGSKIHVTYLYITRLDKNY